MFIHTRTQTHAPLVLVISSVLHDSLVYVILSDVSSDVSSEVFSDVLSDVSSDVLSDVTYLFDPSHYHRTLIAG